jgi:ferredoxin
VNKKDLTRLRLSGENCAAKLRRKTMTIFYFTATGNSLYAAKTLGGKLYSIPQLLKEGQFEFADDSIGFVFPVYGFGLPKIVKRFLKAVRYTSQYTFAIGTYGNMAGSCMNNLAKDFHAAGRELNYADSILMVDNYLPFFEIESQLKKVKEKRIDEHLQIIVNNVKSKKNSIPRAWVMSRMFTACVSWAVSRMINGKSAQKYTVNEKCTACGTCVKACPTGNIEIQDKVVFASSCELCYACVHICPHTAIHLKNERSGARFRNENISVEEILRANNQK